MFWAKATSASLKLASALSETVDPVDDAVAAAVSDEAVGDSEEDEPQPASTRAVDTATEANRKFMGALPTAFYWNYDTV